MTELKAFTSAITALGGQFDNIAADAGGVIDGAPALSGVLSSHGTIGYPADFSGVGDARSGAVTAAKIASEKMGDTLRQAAEAYARGDLEAAQRLKAQADRMGGASAASSPNAAGGLGGAQDGGAQAGGQMMGQFSQLAGQMMQGITQPVQGIVQGLSQIPQQAMQGVQGIVQAATQGAAGGGATATDAVAQANASGAGAASGPAVSPSAEAGSPDGAGAPGEGEKAPAQAGIMSEERMRELQGLPPIPHGGTTDPEIKSDSSPHPRTARDM